MQVQQARSPLTVIDQQDGLVVFLYDGVHADFMLGKAARGRGVWGFGNGVL